MCACVALLRVHVPKSAPRGRLTVWKWNRKPGYRMINKVASSFQVNLRLRCMINCTLSPICDSYNYRAADKMCQLNRHDHPLTANSGDIVADGSWAWYSSSFTVVDG